MSVASVAGKTGWRGQNWDVRVQAIDYVPDKQRVAGPPVNRDAASRETCWEDSGKFRACEPPKEPAWGCLPPWRGLVTSSASPARIFQPARSSAYNPLTVPGLPSGRGPREGPMPARAAVGARSACSQQRAGSGAILPRQHTGAS